MPAKKTRNPLNKKEEAGAAVPEEVDDGPPKGDLEGSSSSSSDEEEDDDLVLEGVMIRNPDVSDSDDTSSEEDEDDEESKFPPAKRTKTTDTNKHIDSKKNLQDRNITKKSNNHKQKNKKQKKKEGGPEIIQVDFVFCDMNEKFFFGIKTLLTATSPVFGTCSSELTDLMIKNVSVGTVTSTEGDTDGTVFGFASVLNVTSSQDQGCIQSLKKICLEKCPDSRRKELQIVLSGQTKRPAGFYLHGRMVNMPLEIVQVQHEQLVLDMDWAVNNAQGGEEKRKSLDFGAFVMFAPTYKASGGVTFYKQFDDEIFATHAEFVFEIELPKSPGAEESPFCNVIVLTKTGHRDAMKSMAEMINKR